MDDEVAKHYPHLAANRPKWVENMTTSPSLCAATCVYIATGAAKDVLKGRYFDCEQDIQTVIEDGRKEVDQKELYTLKVDFLGGLKNDGGIANKAYSFD